MLFLWRLIMKSGYIAIGYACNQKCSFCPCSSVETTYPFIRIEELEQAVDKMIEETEIDSVVVSGGEPTIHPNFINFISYLTEREIRTLILSNSEMFFKTSFIDDFCRRINIEKVSVITTLHSQKKEEHESINQTKDSFSRTVLGLKKLIERGIHVTIKHCITKMNYQDLCQFYRFIDSTFPQDVDVQMCSIDYCGLKENDYEEQMLVFPELGKYFEEMFDEYMLDLETGSKRHVYCINMPLCSCDPYYWKFFEQKSQEYLSYASPSKEGGPEVILSIENNVGTFFEECRSCKAEPICPGTYRTAFEIYGNKIVEKYINKLST